MHFKEEITSTIVKGPLAYASLRQRLRTGRTPAFTAWEENGMDGWKQYDRITKRFANELVARCDSGDWPGFRIRLGEFALELQGNVFEVSEDAVYGAVDTVALVLQRGGFRQRLFKPWKAFRGAYAAELQRPGSTPQTLDRVIRRFFRDPASPPRWTSAIGRLKELYRNWLDHFPRTD
jgi:hypothetical protein